jgi:hypothetical protein
VKAHQEQERCSFVCLNDTIDKIILPKFGRLGGVNSRTVHVPVINEIGTDDGTDGLRWYGKRAKLIAAFQRFSFQYTELRQSRETAEFPKLARYFADRIASYDFWTAVPMWRFIGHLHAALNRFRETGQPGLLAIEAPKGFSPEFVPWLRDNDILELWRLLALLPRMYEDICREWLLPTGVGLMGSFGALEQRINAGQE